MREAGFDPKKVGAVNYNMTNVYFPPNNRACYKSAKIPFGYKWTPVKVEQHFAHLNKSNSPIYCLACMLQITVGDYLSVPYGHHVHKHCDSSHLAIVQRIRDFQLSTAPQTIPHCHDNLTPSVWQEKTKRFGHYHSGFAGGVENLIGDCCRNCPLLQTTAEREAYFALPVGVSSSLKFLDDNPGRQMVGSFNPIIATLDHWTQMAYNWKV